MYIAARGGEKAIGQAESLFLELLGPVGPERVRLIEEAMPYLLDRVMGEGSLYAPELAALALAQTGGDGYEAVLLLRAYRSTQPRIGYARVIEQHEVRTARRISAAFKDVPGGQVLGPTLDYSHRVLMMPVIKDGQTVHRQAETAPTRSPSSFPALAAWQRAAGLLPDSVPDETLPEDIPDVTREPMLIPASRAQVLQSLARADTGGVLALGYANMRGYGPIHPTINEVRLGYADVRLTHPGTLVPFSAGRVRISSAEIVTEFGGGTEQPHLELGFSATFGWNEVKVIAASMLDMAMTREHPHPAMTQEFVLYHTEPVESSGFCIHYKLPHYVTFQSSLEAMRGVRSQRAEPDPEFRMEREPETPRVSS
jgi:alpha-D-ribose 1-methylphosphonate 5-triphosphate synthase subunit PhnI